MINLDILTDIELEQNKSELNVLYSICESYNKILQMMNESQDDSFIQESVLFTEADDVKKDPSFKDKFLAIISKIFDALKNLIVKAIDIVTKIFIKHKTSHYAAINCLNILDAFQHVSVSSVIQESGLCVVEFDGIYAEYNTDEVNEEIVQEKWSPIDEMRYKKAEKNIAKAKGMEITPDEIAKGLKKFYNVEVRHKIISKKEITDIVKCICMTAPPGTVEELKSMIKKFEDTDEMKKLSNEALRYHSFITETVAKKNQERWDKLCSMKRKQCKTVEQADAEMKVMESLVEGVGATLGKLTKNRAIGNKNVVMDLTTENFLKAGIRLTGDVSHGIMKSFVDVASLMYSSITQIPQILGSLKQKVLMLTTNIKEKGTINTGVEMIGKTKETVDKALTKTGSELRDEYEDFQRTYHKEDDKLKELGLRTNKLVKTVKFCADGLGEETIIIGQDEINDDLYRQENWKDPKKLPVLIGKMIYGGPCTFTMKIICLLAPGYLAWAVAMANTSDLKTSIAAGGVAIGANAMGKALSYVNVKTIGTVFKSLFGIQWKSYVANKLSGDIDRPTPTMQHEEMEKEKKRQERAQRRQSIIPIPEPVQSRVNSQ